MPVDVMLVVAGITGAFVVFGALLLFADLTWRPRKQVRGRSEADAAIGDEPA